MTGRTGYIYVLHFDNKLSHAEHYIGCTTQPKDRLISHASGRGSRICQVLIERGIGWRLGMLATCSLTEMRLLERQLKRQHGAQPYCELCHNSPYQEPRRLAGTRPLALDLVPWPTHSDSLRLLGSPWTLQVRHVAADEPRNTMEQIEDLMRADRHSLGFIPVGGSGGLEYSRSHGRLIVATVGEQVAGYLCYTVSRTPGMGVHIQQTCTRDSLRGCGVGRAMVDYLGDKWAWEPLTAWVRDDLSANEFWERIGFYMVQSKTHKTSGSTLNQYERGPRRESSNGEELHATDL